MSVNQAEAYGVKIETSTATGTCWRAVLVRHLSPSENRGKQNLFVDVVDETGVRVFDDRLRIAWFDHPGDLTADYTRLDKPDTPLEFGDGNVPISKAQTLTAWVHGDGLPSDRVVGIHTRHPDEDTGNSWGHHSFYVRFQRTTKAVTVPPTDKPSDPTLADHERRIAKIEQWVRSFERTMIGD